MRDGFGSIVELCLKWGGEELGFHIAVVVFGDVGFFLGGGIFCSGEVTEAWDGGREKG